eukprot:scaffold1827_cov421-Prasinococcus_capsulatus_cf.AAC.38
MATQIECSRQWLASAGWQSHRQGEPNQAGAGPAGQATAFCALAALADAAGDVIVRTVARTEPASVVASARQRHAPQVGAHSEHHEPARVLGAILVCFGVAKGRQVHTTGTLYLGVCAAADEHGLAPPLHGDRLSLLYCAEVHLQRGKG